MDSRVELTVEKVNIHFDNHLTLEKSLKVGYEKLHRRSVDELNSYLKGEELISYKYGLDYCNFEFSDKKELTIMLSGDNLSFSTSIHKEKTSSGTLIKSILLKYKSKNTSERWDKNDTLDSRIGKEFVILSPSGNTLFLNFKDCLPLFFCSLLVADNRGNRTNMLNWNNSQ